MAVPEHPSSNQVDLARRFSAPARQKRFYARAEMPPEEAGFSLRLDGRRARTPGRNSMIVRDPRVAEAIAAEWNAQGETIEPASMPVTRLVNTAIDGVAGQMEEVREAVRAYAATDLLYYRASEPERLVAQQALHWDPVLAWAEAQFSGRFILAEGVMHVTQPAATLAAIGAAIHQFDDPLRLAGLHLATTLSGSALLALALEAGMIGVDAAWDAAHVDEDWNISQWGADAEAMQRRTRRREDFGAAALALMRG